MMRRRKKKQKKTARNKNKDGGAGSGGGSDSGGDGDGDGNSIGNNGIDYISEPSSEHGQVFYTCLAGVLHVFTLVGGSWGLDLRTITSTSGLTKSSAEA